MADTTRLTMAQALIRYLANQYVERDGIENKFFAGVWGIFGHGNVAGLGEALREYRDEIRYYQCRNEQAQVHTAIAYSKVKNRLETFACTSSIGPGATNMVTGAATATADRIPVLLLPGDIFAERIQAPVLQQVEFEHSQDISVNDCFKPVSRYWDRLYRPDQLIAALPETMRVLTSPADTGAVTLCLPQDTQAEAYDYPTALFEKRVWRIPRNRPDLASLKQAAQWIRESTNPIIVCGGGVHYSDATETFREFVDATGIPVGMTHAGKGALPYDHPLNLGGIGVTGTPGANIMAREADLVIGIGTRFTDFTTQSNALFQNPNLRSININVAEWDAYKHYAIPLIGDAKVTMEELLPLLENFHTDESYYQRTVQFNASWDEEVHRIYNLEHGPLMSQGVVMGTVNTLSNPKDIMLNAAGSMPGDLHKVWRTRDPKGYHMEYGFSCMGYEIAGGLGAKMAAPERDVYVFVGDGSYLMMNTEIVTMVQEGIKVVIVLVDNHGFASIGGLANAVGIDGFGTKYRHRTDSDQLDGETLPIDFAANASSLGCQTVRVHDRDELADAILEAKEYDGGPVCIVVETDRSQRIGMYESWWDVGTPEVSTDLDVQQARAENDAGKKNQHYYL